MAVGVVDDWLLALSRLCDAFTGAQHNKLRKKGLIGILEPNPKQRGLQPETSKESADLKLLNLL